MTLVVAFAGTREEVDWQMAKTSELFRTTPANLDYEETFWANETAGTVHKLSVLPSRLIEVLATLDYSQFVARAGNGVIYYRGRPLTPTASAPVGLAQRVKEAFDPHHVFPMLSP